MCPAGKPSSLPTFRFKNVFDSMFFVLVLSPKDGARARARNRSICEFDYEHEHHFIEHEHEFKLKDVGKDEHANHRLMAQIHSASTTPKSLWNYPRVIALIASWNKTCAETLFRKCGYCYLSRSRGSAGRIAKLSDFVCNAMKCRAARDVPSKAAHGNVKQMGVEQQAV